MFSVVFLCNLVCVCRSVSAKSLAPVSESSIGEGGGGGEGAVRCRCPNTQKQPKIDRDIII